MGDRQQQVGDRHHQIEAERRERKLSISSSSPWGSLDHRVSKDEAAQPPKALNLINLADGHPWSTFTIEYVQLERKRVGGDASSVKLNLTDPCRTVLFQYHA